jgi:hypothetical protein
LTAVTGLRETVEARLVHAKNSLIEISLTARDRLGGFVDFCPPFRRGVFLPQRIGRKTAAALPTDAAPAGALVSAERRGPFSSSV